MAGHEARINEALKQLGEEFRLGMVAVEEYRARRKMLLESWGEREITTAPGSIKSLSTTGPTLPPTRTPTVAKPTPAAAPPKPKNPAVLVIVAAAALALAGGGYFAFTHRASAPGPVAAIPAAPAVAPASPEVLAVKKAADEFLARNSWDPDPIDAFLAQWQALSPGDRTRALEEPSLRTLRYELQQNLKAESQLVPADAPPDQRRRLDALSRFARELGD